LNENLKKTILIIDDNPDDREFYCDCLTSGKGSYHFFEASTAREGLRLFIEYSPDLVLLDYLLPDQNGLSLIHDLHRERDRVVPIIMLTGAGNEEVAVEALKAGVVDYIVKDHVNSETMQKVVGNAIEKANLENELITHQINLELANTGLRKHQRALEEKNNELKKISEAKGIFLSTMSHEIRTPMSAILGFTDLLIEKEDNYEKLEFLDLIKVSGQGLVCIINDILTFSKLDSGMVEVEKIDFNLRDFLETTIKLYSNEAQKKNIKLDLKIDKEVIVFYLGDSHRLRQILSNLISNALKFTEVGTITLNVSRKSQGDLLFEVIDTGIGIEESKLELIFDSFSQADTSTTRKFGGTGLGLSIVKRLTALWGGVVEVKSNPGVGSTFSISLPMEESSNISLLDEKKEFNVEPLSQIDLSSIKVLLCEDNNVIIKLMTKYLEKMSIKVDIGKNGQQGVELFKSNEYDIVLMDISMPIMNGLEATVHMRNYEVETKKMATPIVAVSANVLKEDVDCYLSSGFNAHLPKPLCSKTLRETITFFIKENLEIKNA